ncbi:1-deoxy-D-xylulose-5-phosphate reductoisomerase [Marinibaculum pumilum]
MPGRGTPAPVRAARHPGGAARGTRRVTVLGSTGSVGDSTLDLIGRNRDAYRVVALTAFRNVEKLIAQALDLRPELAVIGDPDLHDRLAEGLRGSGVRSEAGASALIAAAAEPADLVVAGIVGAAGLAPTMEAVRNGRAVALANKECLVCAGPLMTALAAERGAALLPVDSEHNAIFQVFDHERPENVERIVLTASGGPFRRCSLAEMRDVTVEQAVNHPVWSMGDKISIDSATMMNKGLELIEAHCLFPVAQDRIEVLIHPQSIVHSMVAYRDGSVLAQLGTPDMRTPIAFALAWPERMAAPVAPLDLARIGSLTFEPADEARFPALRLAREAMAAGGTAPTILNAANEVAVAAFLARRIGFLDIAAIVEETLQRAETDAAGSLEEVWAVDRRARTLATQAMLVREDSRAGAGAGQPVPSSKPSAVASMS